MMETIDILALKPNELRATEEDIMTTRIEARPSVMHPLSHSEHGKKFRLKLPANTKSTSLMVVGSPVSDDKFHHFYVDVYPNYDIAYQEVAKKIDLMLGDVERDSIELEELLIREFGKGDAYRRFLSIAEHYGGLTCLDNALFRNLATGCLIHEALRRCDSEGTILNDALQVMRQSYCDSLDQEPGIKQKIFRALGRPEEAMKPSLELVEEVATWPRRPTFDIVDYEKSPTIHVRLFETKPMKASSNNNNVSVPNSNQVIYTKVFSYEDGKEKPVSTYEALEKYTYKKGDSQRGVKLPSVLTESIELAPPVVSWSVDKKKACFSLKATKIDILDRKVTSAVDQEEMDRRALAFKKKEEMRRDGGSRLLNTLYPTDASPLSTNEGIIFFSLIALLGCIIVYFSK